MAVMVFSTVVFLLISTLDLVAARSFTWPNQTAQCGTYPFNLTGGIPPYNTIMLRVPFLHTAWFRIEPENSGVESFKSQPIEIVLLEAKSGVWEGAYVQAQVQFPYGSYYTMVLTDGTGFGSGGVSPIQQVGAGPSDCLSSASFNLTQQLFSFNVSGSTGECDGNFRLTWDGTPNQGPYNVSIIPLDGGYAPWVIPLQSGAQYYDWQVNLTAGSYFTVMVNNRLNWGAGGVGGVYQVTTGNNPNPGCATQTRNTSALYALPPGLGIETLPPLQAIPSASPTSGSGSALSPGVIAGIAVGGAIVCLALATGLYLVCRKKRPHRDGPQPLDLSDDIDIDIDAGNSEVRSPIDPFMSQLSSNPSLAHQTDHRPVHSQYSNPLPSSSQYSDTGESLQSPLSQDSRTEKKRIHTAYTAGEGANSRANSHTTTPLSGPGAGAGAGATRYISRSSGRRSSTTFSEADLDIGLDIDTRQEPTDRVHRHIDGGLLEMSPESRGEVELPPLYTDIPRDAT